jgi:hypothetical protein
VRWLIRQEWQIGCLWLLPAREVQQLLEFQALCHVGLVPLLVQNEKRRLASRKRKMNFGSLTQPFYKVSVVLASGFTP